MNHPIVEHLLVNTNIIILKNYSHSVKSILLIKSEYTKNINRDHLDNGKQVISQEQLCHLYMRYFFNGSHTMLRIDYVRQSILQRQGNDEIKIFVEVLTKLNVINVRHIIFKCAE